MLHKPTIWHLASFVVFVAIAALMTYPLITDLYATHNNKSLLLKQAKENALLFSQEKIIREKNLHLRQKVESFSTNKSDKVISDDFMLDLFAVANNLGIKILNLKSLRLNKVAQAQDATFELSLSGDYTQYLNLLIFFQHYYLPVIVKKYDLRLRQANGELFIKLDLHLVYLNSQIQGAVKRFALQDLVFFNGENMHNPFQAFSLGHALLLRNFNEDTNVNLLQSVSWRQMRAVGFLQVDKNCYWLLSLPNASTIIVGKDMQIGFEHARVQAVDREKMLVFINGKLEEKLYKIGLK